MASTFDASTGGPAFPDLGNTFGRNGMTLRDYFAAQAMASFVSIIITTKREIVGKAAAAEGRSGDTFDQYIAFRAYEVADAMLAERQKGGA